MSAYVGSSKNLKDLKDLPESIERWIALACRLDRIIRTGPNKTKPNPHTSNQGLQLRSLFRLSHEREPALSQEKEYMLSQEKTTLEEIACKK